MELVTPFTQVYKRVSSALLTMSFLSYVIVFICNLVTLFYLTDSSLGLKKFKDFDLPLNDLIHK